MLQQQQLEMEKQAPTTDVYAQPEKSKKKTNNGSDQTKAQYAQVD